jgi:hypothetical protein
MQAEVVKNRLRPVFFVEIGVSSGTVRLWSGVGPILWDSNTWTGAGKLGKIGGITETTEVQAQGLELELSGVAPDLLGYALTEIRHGKDCKIWLGAKDDNNAIIADPAQAFAGRVDSCHLDEAGEIVNGKKTSTIRLTAESRLVELHRAKVRRYTHEDQQVDYSGDLGFEYVAGLQELNLIWGKGEALPQVGDTSVYPPTGGPPGGYFPS